MRRVARYGRRMNEMQYSRARSDLADLHDHALAHLPTRITRRRSDPAVLLSEEDFKALLTQFEFHPEVLFEGGATAIWLPELALWGRGESFLAAKEDLIEEVDQLLAVLEHDERVRGAANMVSRRPWIFRLLASDAAEREVILFAEPSADRRPAFALAAVSA